MPTSPRPGLSRISCNACHCEGAPRPWQCASPGAAVFMSPTAPFLSAAKEREERTPPKPRFWNPFRGWGVVHVGLLLPRGPGCAKFAPCFRMVSAAPSAGRSRGPALPWRSRDTLCVCRVMRNISCHRFVGDDAHIVPPYRTINNASVGATLAVARGRGRAPSLCIYSLIPRKKEVALRPPLNFCLHWSGLSPPPAGPPGQYAAHPAAFALPTK